VSMWRDAVDFSLGFMFGSRRRKLQPDLFKRRIVISISPWAVPLIALAIGTALIFKLTAFTNVICLAITFGCVFSAWRFRQQMRDLRYSMKHAQNGVDEDDEIEQYEDYIEKIPVKAINGSRNARVSERS
jgi:hypothetical protein